MNTITLVLLIALFGGACYFVYWAIQRTLKEDTGKNRRARRRR